MHQHVAGGVNGDVVDHSIQVAVAKLYFPDLPALPAAATLLDGAEWITLTPTCRLSSSIAPRQRWCPV